MSEVDPIFTVEENNLELVKKPGPNPWLVLGGVLVVIAVVLGWRRAAAKKKRLPDDVPPVETPA